MFASKIPPKDLRRDGAKLRNTRLRNLISPRWITFIVSSLILAPTLGLCLIGIFGCREQELARIHGFGVNVRMHGAAGDGQTDDTGAIGRACAELRRRGGGVLYFPSGIYLFNAELSAADNISIEGEAGGTIFKPFRPGFLLTITGYSRVLDKIHVKGVRIVGGRGKNGLRFVDTHVSMEHVWISDTDVCVRVDHSIGNSFSNCRFYGTDYGLVFFGKAGRSYAGFSSIENTRIAAGKCGIYVDNSSYASAGGNHLRSVWFEGMPGIAYYAKHAAAEFAPDRFEGVWLENVATAESIDLSDVGGPDRLAVERRALFFDKSNAHIENLMTYRISARNGSHITVDRYHSTGGVAPDAALDASSSIRYMAIGTDSRIAAPVNCEVLIPSVAGSSITCLQDRVRSTLDYSLENLLGMTGDGCEAFSRQNPDDTKVSVAIVKDPTAPVFDKCLEISMEAYAEAAFNCLSSSGVKPGVGRVNVHGKVYVQTYNIKNITDGSDVVIDWVNVFDAVRGLRPQTWYAVGGIYVSGEPAPRYLRIINASASKAILRLSQWQLVQFDRMEDAQAFLASNRYAAGTVGGQPRFSLQRHALRQQRGEGPPTESADFVGQEYLDAISGNWYKARLTGRGAADWAELNANENSRN